MPKYESRLKLKKVSQSTFAKSLRTLDSKGSLPLNIACGNEYCLIVENNKTIGYTVSSENCSRVTGLVIHQDYRNKGYGKRIIEQLKENARKNGKELVVCDPFAEPDFFEKCGVKIEWPMFDDGL